VSGLVTSVFFIAMMLPGFFINRLVDMMGRKILLWAMLLIALGLLDVYYNRSLFFIVIGCVAAGFGYGMAQPYIYDKTASFASPSKVTYALALLMSMNYVAIVICPFIVEWFQDAAGVKGERFPFALNATMGFVALLFMLLRLMFVNRKKFRL
jgi:MFS family permease